MTDWKMSDRVKNETGQRRFGKPTSGIVKFNEE